MKNISKTNLLKIFEIGSRVESINLARKKFILSFMMGIILSKSVNFSAIAEHFSPDVKLSSHQRRIERFFNEYQLDYVQIACLLLCFLPPGRISISIDRTNWKFGNQNINYLVITAQSRGVGIPLFFELLDKKGNSNTIERENLLKKLFRILPAKQICSFCADREFIGKRWYKFLIENKIPFYIRVKSDTKITFNGGTFAAKYFAISNKKRIFENIQVYGLTLHLTAKRIVCKNDPKDKYLLILTNGNVEKAMAIYRSRWSIEVFFQSVKKRGFNLEDTHLDELDKLKKLFAFVCLSFAVCFKIGADKNDGQEPIKKRKNGYKRSSFFRYGLDEIRRVLLHFKFDSNPVKKLFENLVRQLKDSFELWSTINDILRL